jgi:MHS family proline/betaine transporter-like MFS transporter
MTSITETGRQGQTKSVRRATTAAGIGNFMEWFDFAIYGFFAPTIGMLFFPGGSPTVQLLAAFAVFGVSFLARPLGGLFYGWLGDRKGRRISLATSVLVMGVSTTLIGLLPTFASVGILAPIALIVLRCAQGFSAGGEWTGSSAYIVEYAPSDKRGLYGSIMSTTAALAGAAASALALMMNTTLTPAEMQDWGWRVPFLCAAPVTLIGLYVRLKLEDTPVFSKLVLQEKLKSNPIVHAAMNNTRAIFITLVLAAIQGVGYYYFTTFMANFLSVTVALPRREALLLTAVGLCIYASLCPLAGILADRVGRRKLNIWGSLGFVVSAIPIFFLLSRGNHLEIILGLTIFGLFQSFVSVSGVLLLVELFPPATRASGSAMGWNLGLVVFAGPSPFIAASIVAATGNALMPAAYLIAIAILSVFVGYKFLPETIGRDLSEDYGTARK